MAKKKEESLDWELDTTEEYQEIPIQSSIKEQRISNKKEIVSCLRNERVIVKHIPKQLGKITNPKHVLYGGLSENAKKVFVTPRLESGLYVNVLTDNEKAFLEQVMGLEDNALSIYKKVNNFWDDNSDMGISKVELRKGENILDLSDPQDYIKYKILLANKDFICPSLDALQNSKKATYQFVIISEEDESKHTQDNMSNIQKCYLEFGKVSENVDILRLIIETLKGRPTSSNSKIEFLQQEINTLIQADSKLFLRTITDPMLGTKVLIKQAIEAGIISNRGNFLYMRDTNSPLCEEGQDPTLSVAAHYLNSPKHQELKFTIEAKLKK